MFIVRAGASFEIGAVLDTFAGLSSTTVLSCMKCWTISRFDANSSQVELTERVSRLSFEPLFV